METESGKKCAEILNRGEAVSEDMVIKMIEEKVNSPEVAHHGKNWFYNKIHGTEGRIGASKMELLPVEVVEYYSHVLQ